MKSINELLQKLILILFIYIIKNVVSRSKLIRDILSILGGIVNI